MANRRCPATLPDVESWAHPGASVADACPLNEEGQRVVAEQIEPMLGAAQNDWPANLPVSPPVSLAWVEAFDGHWSRKRVADLLAAADAGDFANDAVVLTCELGAILGSVLRQAAPQLEWLAGWPYWESALLDVPSGRRLNVFHWAIKRFSEYGLEDGHSAKVTTCVDLVRSGWV